MHIFIKSNPNLTLSKFTKTIAASQNGPHRLSTKADDASYSTSQLRFSVSASALYPIPCRCELANQSLPCWPSSPGSASPTFVREQRGVRHSNRSSYRKLFFFFLSFFFYSFDFERERLNLCECAGLASAPATSFPSAFSRIIDRKSVVCRSDGFWRFKCLQRGLRSAKEATTF